jgi:hypothetical protein
MALFFLPWVWRLNVKFLLENWHPPKKLCFL